MVGRSSWIMFKPWQAHVQTCHKTDVLITVKHNNHVMMSTDSTYSSNYRNIVRARTR